MTTTLTISADGHIYPPYFIVASKAKKVPCEAPDDIIGKKYYPEAQYYATKEGWMTNEAFHNYLKWLYGQLVQRGVKLPVVLVCSFLF